MTLRTFFSNLLFPPRCISCRRFSAKDILDPCDSPFCDKCRLEWEREKTETCARCGMELLLCRCSSGKMEKAGVGVSLKLIHYRAGKNTVGRRAVLYLKTHTHKRAFRFFAEQLSFPVRRYMKEKDLASEEVCFCYVPRSYKSEETYGLDQAEQLCRALAACFDCDAVPLFYRIGTGDAAQKTLSAKAREDNMKERFEIDGHEWCKIAETVKCLFLVDDVITTGASVSACARLLKGRYEGETVAVSLARTPLLRRRRLEKGIKI